MDQDRFADDEFPTPMSRTPRVAPPGVQLGDIAVVAVLKEIRDIAKAILAAIEKLDVLK